MGFLKRVFCSHSWKKIKEYHGSSKIQKDGTYSDLPYGYRWKSNITSFGKVNEYECNKCGKHIHQFVGGDTK